MGLLQKAVETYDSHRSLVGDYTEERALLAPVAHTVRKVDIEIILTVTGKFYDANASCRGENIIIPATMESAGRSGKVISPHPLSDQLCYIAPFGKEKYQAYVEQLSAWEQSKYTHPKLKPILSYVRNGSILKDLERVGLIQLNANGEPDENDKKLMVRWRVLGLDDNVNDSCWKDKTLFSSFSQYYLECLDETNYCMVLGVDTLLAKQHAKGIVPSWPSAKLVSSNDKNGFTYRGRFTQEKQALTVSYEASQKAHNALRWLVDSQGARANYGNRIFLCWIPNGKTISRPHLPFMTPPEPITRPSDYRDELQKVLCGRKAELNIQDGVVLAAFDAATTGRLALTYYNELRAHDFLERLHAWDSVCCWPHKYRGIVSPALSQIVNYAFGTPRALRGVVKMVADDRLLREQMQRLIACRVDRACIGADVVNSLVSRASNLEIYKRFEPNISRRDIREDLLSITCAVIRKYRTDRFKEEWSMALNPNSTDRSYQFGRLMAIFEHIEKIVCWKTGQEHRTTYTIRHQKAFCNKPLTTAVDIHEHLHDAYFPRLSAGKQHYFQILIGKVFENLSCMPEEKLNLKLSETYLMGYYLQRNELTSRNENYTAEEEDE